MTNPLTKNCITVFDLQSEFENRRIVIAYGERGCHPCRAFNGYSNEVLATAWGGGYDKTTSALTQAVRKLTKIPDVSNCNSIDAIQLKLREHGQWKLIKLI